MSELDFLFCNPKPVPSFDPAESQRLIEEHIRKHGVTRCPTAFAVATVNAEVSQRDLAAHVEREQPKVRAGRKPTAKWKKQATGNAMLKARERRADRKATTWAPARLAELLRLYDTHGPDWVVIGAALGVSRYAALGTYTRLKNGRYDDLIGRMTECGRRL